MEKSVTHTQLVLVEFHNCGPFLYKFKSNRKITVNMVNKYLRKYEDFDADNRDDGFTFVDEPSDTVVL